jgi:PIF1-like helicase
MLRGDALEHLNIVEYFVHTYEDDMDRRYLDTNDDESDPLTDQHRKPGRKRNERVLYRRNHPRFNQKLRIVRSRGHNQLPNFIGRFFPRADDPDIYEFYCACMLLLLKPWRTVEVDLKEPSQSWTDALTSFLATAPKKSKDIITGIQYFYESRSAAEEEHERDRDEDDAFTGSTRRAGCDQSEEDFELGEDAHIPDDTFTEEGLAALIASQVPLREELHGRFAVEKAKYAKIFTADNSQWNLDKELPPVVNATGDDLRRLLHWRTQMEADVAAQNLGSDAPREEEPGLDTGGVSRLTNLHNASGDHGDVSPETANVLAESSIPAVNPSLLKDDQFRTYDIITWHLEQTLAGKKPPPLRMLIHGEGGTGKSRVIQTVTEQFSRRGSKFILMKAAYTGVAASLIDGKTTHVIRMISTSGRPMSDETKAKLQKFWKYFIYLIIDEISMISKSFLAVLSRHIGIGKQTVGQVTSDLSFGGINVIFCGDFHQFPPVVCAGSEALYQPSNMAVDSVDSQIGRAIYEEFNTVVILREQCRVTDDVWRDFLMHLRYGRVEERHLATLRELIIANPKCPPTDFTCTPWNNAALVTPRHAVRKQWNEAAVRKHCRETSQCLFICPAEDRINNRRLSLAERYGVVTRGCKMNGDRSRKRRRRVNDLPDVVEIAVGMKVMVTENLETDLDVTNGARGEIVNIILHPDEPPIGDEPIITLQHLPSYILVKMDRTRATQLEGLDESIIPVQMAT